MARPVVGSVAEEIYASLLAFHTYDESLNWPLLHYCQAIGLQYQAVRDIAFDSDADVPAWRTLFDIDNCPVWAIPYLGQFVGVRIPAYVTTAAGQRAWVKDAAGWRRGRNSALIAAIQSTLTGTKTVVVRNRYLAADGWAVDNPGHIYVRTRTSETPDSAATLSAATAAKLIGLVLNYAAVPGQDWQNVITTRANWTAVTTAYPTWQHVIESP